MVLYPPYGIICCRSKSMVLHWKISQQKLLFSIGWIKGKEKVCYWTQILNSEHLYCIYIWVIPYQLTQFWKISHLTDSDFDDMQCRGSSSIENNIWRV